MSKRVLIAMTAALLMATACGTSGDNSTGTTLSPADTGGMDSDTTNAETTDTEAAEESELKRVSLRLDFLPAGTHVGFVVAAEKGFYRDAGLDVTIGAGVGSSTTAQLIGNLGDTFGFASMGAVAQVIEAGAPIKAVMGVIQLDTLALITNPEITDIKQMEGKRLASIPGSASESMLPVLFGAAGVDLETVEMVNISAGSKVAAMGSGEVDATTGHAIHELIQLELAGIETNEFYLSDFGVTSLAWSVIAHDDTIANDPDLIESFVCASQRGLEYAVENQEEAVDLLIAQFPDADPILTLRGWEAAIDHLHTDRTMDEPIGVVDEQDVVDTVETLRSAGLLTDSNSDPNLYYDGDFIANCSQE